tara:strand:+ start:208 stop:426 length:219 start_codon:yes stop_codon:yes gene_type:complete
VSKEKIINSDIKGLLPLVAPQTNSDASSSRRVDINILLNRARKVKEKENLTNVIFVGLTTVLIFIVGIILSF